MCGAGGVRRAPSVCTLTEEKRSERRMETLKRSERARSGRGRGVACEGAWVQKVSCGGGRGVGGARARHGQPSLSQGHSGRRRGTQRGWQASAAAHAFAEEGETGEGRAVATRQPRSGRQRTSQLRPPAQSAGVQQSHASVALTGEKSGFAVNGEATFSPKGVPRVPRKEGGPALWQVPRRVHALKGKSDLRGCRNLAVDAKSVEKK